MEGIWGVLVIVAVIPKRARFSAFSAASTSMVFSASVCLVIFASRRAPFACLALAAIAFELDAARLLISRV